MTFGGEMAVRTGIANLPLHGGKDSIPYPVDRQTYDQGIEILHKAINRSRLGLSEKREAEGRLRKIVGEG
jgi:hypothetical protein